MISRKVKLMSAVAALSIALTGGMATASFVHAATQALPLAQASQPQQPQTDKGVVIVSVLADSPAAKAGLKRGNILLQVDGKDVNTVRDVRAALANKKKGDKVDLTFSAGDQQQKATATLDEQNGVVYLGIESGRLGGVAPLPNIDPSQLPQMISPEVRVTQVVSDSPAAKAGIMAGDVISAANGTQLTSTLTLRTIVAQAKMGDKLSLTLTHPGASAPVTVDVTLGENPNQKGTPWLGIRFAPALRFRRGFGGQLGQGDRVPAQTGVFAAQVTKDSPADKAGLQVGDVISAANGSTIKTPTDLVDLVAKSKIGDKLSLSITHQGASTPVTIDVTLGENPNKKGSAWLGVALGSRMNLRQRLPGGVQGGLPGFPAQQRAPNGAGGNL